MSELTFQSVSATGWTATGGTELAVLSDTDDGTIIASPDNPSSSIVDLTMPAIEAPAGDLVVTLRLSHLNASTSSATVTLRDGTTTVATATISGTISTTASGITATFAAANISGVSAATWQAGTLVIRVSVTAAV